MSYASQDTEAARRICDALREAGIEVWFDQSELRGGDAWDRAIRTQIKTCLLFIPVISKNTHDRDEGYFRLEWKLAVDRSHLMTGNKAFLLPVAIDDTRDDDENVPDRFREVQWTRLLSGETTPAFVQRVQRLISPERSAGSTAHPASAVSGAATATPEPAPAPWPWKTVLLAIFAVALLGVGYLVADRLLWSKHPAEARVAAVPAAQVTASGTAPFSPPPHSIAVLPFVNMSGDKNQEYFSEGLTEELLNSLSRINELQVAARTSSFSFASEHPDIGTVAHKLNVGAVLEGSVRRSAHTVRVTAQLINGVTGFHVWSQTYDRNLGDVLQLQTEIATAVATVLKVALLGDEAAKIELGGTRNPKAFDAYLRATKTYFDPQNEKNVEDSIPGYTEALRLDPDYALAYAARSLALVAFAEDSAAPTSAIRARLDRARADAAKAIDLAPNLGAGHLALARVYETRLEFKPAGEEYERALTLAPGNVRVLWLYGVFAAWMGHSDSALTALRRAVTLDPLNLQAHNSLDDGLLYLGRYAEAIAAYKDTESLFPTAPTYDAQIGWSYYLLGDSESARSACEKAPEGNNRWICLAMAYNKLGRHANAEATLTKLRAAEGDTGALGYCLIYGEWGDTARALDWLDTALRLRNPDLIQLKHPMYDTLRKEPRFQAVERALKFPD